MSYVIHIADVLYSPARCHM